MARDALEAATVASGRKLEARESDDPLPAPPPPAVGPAAVAAAAAERGFARRLVDVMRRRSALWLAGDRGRSVVSEVATALAERLGWGAERMRDEIEVYEASLREEASLLDRAREDA
jgi:hypothetical protein